MSAPTSSARWFDAAKGEVNRQALAYVRSVDAQQAHVYNKFIRCAALYDMPPRPRTAGDFVESAITNGGRMHENVIASAVDTVSAQIATTDIRAVFDTDGADWSTQRKARHREWYSEQLGKLLDIPAKLQRAFKAGTAVKGTGAIKVYIDAFDQIRVDTVMVDDIVVDELECRNGPPRQMHYRTPLDKEELKAQFPSHAIEIDRAQSGTAQNPRLWAGYRMIERHEVMVLESWKLPIGTYGHERYKPGRHTIVIDGCDLLDEEYDDAWFPIVTFRWEEPTQGWYGIGLVERNAGLQRALNRRNLQIERQNDQGAFPTTWIHRSDSALRNQAVTQNAIGTVAMYGGAQPPTTVIPQAVSQQTYMDADRLGAKIFENTGISRMAAQSVKPAGVETGVALREYRDQTTQRFARQEKGYERFYLDVIVLVLDCCRKLSSKAPKVMKRTRFGSRKLSWTDVDMMDVRIQIGAASTVSRSRAGRLQSVVEWAQSGIISQDTARRLLNHPDLEREMSLYTAAIENVEACLEEIADGGVVMPEPFMNLKLLVWRAQQQYLNWSADGAPEEILENLRTLIVQAAWMVSGGDAANENAAAGVGPDASMAPPGASGPGAPPSAPPPMPPGMPPLPGMPMEPHPQAAFSPQAMQLSAWG